MDNSVKCGLKALNGFLLFIFVIGVILGAFLRDGGSYKTGQLDYQRGEIKYILNEDGSYYEVHNER